jgi:hypothetical protein
MGWWGGGSGRGEAEEFLFRSTGSRDQRGVYVCLKFWGRIPRYVLMCFRRIHVVLGLSEV